MMGVRNVLIFKRQIIKRVTGILSLRNIYKKGVIMRLSAPKNTTWLLALILGGLGIASNFVTIPVVGGYTFLLVSAGFVLLVLATFLKGL